MEPALRKLAAEMVGRTYRIRDLVEPVDGAAIVPVSPKTLRLMARDGRFPAPIGMDGVWLWRGVDVLDWLVSPQPSAGSGDQTRGHHGTT
jgi:hypothetical protein